MITLSSLDFQWDVEAQYSGFKAIKSGQLNAQGEIDGAGMVYVLGANHLLEGTFSQDIIDGYGQYTYPSGQFYIGQWKKAKKFGHGSYTYDSGDKYTGDYIDDKKHGNGKYEHKSGKIEEGTFQNNKLHGKAKITDIDGSVSYGNFKNDKYTGPAK